MRLAVFAVDTPTGPTTRIGVLDDDSLLDVTLGYATVLDQRGHTNPERLATAVAPPSMLEFLRNGGDALDAAAAVAGLADSVIDSADHTIRFALDEVTFQSPLPRPNTIRDFSTFEGHGSEKVEAWYELPVYYKGNPDSVVAPGTTVHWPSYTDQLDFELEVAAIIGTAGRNIPAADAASHIAGYTIFNDFSARDIQRREMQARLGPAKGKDFANGLGPYLATPESFDPLAASVTARVNGEVWFDGDLRGMHHSFADMIEHASLDETLHPGDVLGSGTVPGGCGADLDRWIDPGDTIELTVDGIGTLTHHVER